MIFTCGVRFMPAEVVVSERPRVGIVQRGLMALRSVIASKRLQSSWSIWRS